MKSDQKIFESGNLLVTTPRRAGKLFFLILIIGLISSCIKPAPAPCNSPPPGILLRIVDSSGNDLLSPSALGNYADSVKLCTGTPNGDTIVHYLESVVDQDQKIVHQLLFVTIGYHCVGGNTFYLHRSHSIIDTLYANYTFDNSGCEAFQVKEIKFNGVVLNLLNDSNTWYYYKAIGRAH